MFDNVYGEPHPLVTAERASYASYLASFVDGESVDGQSIDSVEEGAR
jgi:hypothetical protein